MPLGQSEPYTIVLTTQDWIGSEQPLVTVTTTNLVDPFGIGFAGHWQPRRLGVCFEQRRHGHDGPDLLAGLDDPGRLRCRIPADDDNLRQRPKHGPKHGADRLPHSAGRGGVSAAFLEPRDNYTSNSAATEEVLGYSTYATATTENIYLVGFFHRRRGDDKPNIGRDDIADGTMV